MRFWTEARVMTAAAAALAVAVTIPACVSARKKEIHQKLSASHVALAGKLIEQGRMREALTQANMALDEWGKNPEAWFVRGQVDFGLGIYSTAIQDFTTAMSYRDNFTEALSWRAWANSESGNPDAAEKDWKQALKDPRYPYPEKIELNLGLLYLKNGREAEGMTHLQRAVSLNPAYARGHYELGKVQQEKGDLNAATLSYEAALGGMHDSADVNLRLAIVLERRGEGARATEYFKRVIELQPDGPEADTARDHLKHLDPAT